VYITLHAKAALSVAARLELKLRLGMFARIGRIITPSPLQTMRMALELSCYPDVKCVFMEHDSILSQRHEKGHPSSWTRCKALPISL